MRTHSTIEPLESRIAPAMATLHIVNPHTATYTDVDGDHVFVTVSAGTLTGGLFTGVASGIGDQLQRLELIATAFEKVNVTISVVKAAGGDGLANIGYLDATGRDLGAVTVAGDLGQIDAGTGTAGTPAIKSLTVRSLGRLGTDTQAGVGSMESNITGALGALRVAGDVKDASVIVTGGADGRLGGVTIGGSLIGGPVNNSGEIFSTGDMGAVKIGGDVQGGSGGASGVIESGRNLASVSIGGSLIGGSNLESGEIVSGIDMGAVKIAHYVQGGSGNSSGYINSGGKLAGVTVGGSLIGGSAMHTGEIFSTHDMGAVKIGHDVQGGSGLESGRISAGGNLAGVSIGGSLIGGSNSFSGEIVSGVAIGAVQIGGDVQGGSGAFSGVIESGNGKLASVTVGGSLRGGSAQSTGAILANQDIGPVKIGHDFTGGSITGTASLSGSGLISTSSGSIASVAIGGSIISGIDASSGTLTVDATIRAARDIGSLTVAGSLIGHGDTGTGASPIVISARGQAVQGATTDLAIGRISVGGRVEFANILAGHDTGLSAANGDAQIGAVSVGGDWIASNLVAGALNLGADNAGGGAGANADNVNFGDSHDFSIGAGSAKIIARIASITIKGQLFGTRASVSTTDHFGFVAEQIGSLRIGGFAFTVPTNHTPLDIGETADVSVHIIP